MAQAVARIAFARAPLPVSTHVTQARLAKALQQLTHR
jgi:hypothetical protein